MKNGIISIIMKGVLGKKIIVITGASRGLGKALADSFSSPRNILVLCAKDLKELKAVCTNLKKKGADCYPTKVDVSKKSGDLISMILLSIL